MGAAGGPPVEPPVQIFSLFFFFFFFPFFFWFLGVGGGVDTKIKIEENQKGPTTF